MSVSPTPNPETVAALLDTAWRLTSSEAARTDALDRKAASVATFASLVLSLTATLGQRFLETVGGIAPFLLYVLGLLALIGSAAFAVRVLIPKAHITLGLAYVERFPTWSEIRKLPEEVQGETMQGLVEAIAHERNVSQRKAVDIRIAYALLLAGLVLVALEASILAGKELL